SCARTVRAGAATRKTADGAVVVATDAVNGALPPTSNDVPAAQPHSQTTATPAWYDGTPAAVGMGYPAAESWYRDWVHAGANKDDLQTAARELENPFLTATKRAQAAVAQAAQRQRQSYTGERPEWEKLVAAWDVYKRASEAVVASQRARIH